jgi:RHS repeat-associated protein
LKYRVGYQGDWTDPRSGDVNEGARWYNPGTGTFNSQDTVTYNAGTSSSVLNLYAYAGGNPLTNSDPDGHAPKDPGGGGNCTRDYKHPKRVLSGNGDDLITIYPLICNGPKPPPPPTPDCHKTHSCDPKCPPGGGGKNCPPPDGGCKKKCDPTPPDTCKTHCGPKPPPPPICDAQCQLNKKIKKERDDLEQDAKTIKQPPPGNPFCASGNPLCPGDPSQPATVVTSGGDLTDETSAWSNQQYETALNQYGSVISSVSTTGTYNWFNSIQICDSADCGGEPGEPQVGGEVGGEGGGGEGSGSEAGGGESGTGELEVGGSSASGGCGCTPSVDEPGPPPGNEFFKGNNLASESRSTHIGDGHRFGGEEGNPHFPEDWSDEKL